MTKLRGKATSIDMEFGKRLRTFRKSAGLNQLQLAVAVSISYQQIQKYETGANRISASTLFELANVLGVDLTGFFDGLKPTSRRQKAKRGKIAKAKSGPVKRAKG